MAHKGYEDAICLAEEQLKKQDPAQVVANTGVVWTGETYEIPWLGQQIALEDASLEQKIIWMHYMNTQGPKKTRGVYINYKQVPGAAIYNANFIKRCIDPMVQVFSNDLEGFWEKGKALGGQRVPHGHMGFTLPVLPYLPVTFIIWQGDDEVPSNGNILFDETAIEWLCPEDLVVLASLPVYTMMKMK